MFKKILSIMSVMFAMAFMFMQPAAAIDYDSPETMMVSLDGPDTAQAIPIDDVTSFPIMTVAFTYLEKEQTHSRLDFVTGHRNIAVFSNVQGGGFVLAHGSKVRF